MLQKLTVLIACTCAVTVSGTDLSTSSRPVLDDAVIAAINNDPTSSWQAARNPRFESMSQTEAKQLLMQMPTNVQHLSTTTVITSETPLPSLQKNPTNFDCREQWPGCIGAIRDQKACGGCWAFGAAETLSDRFCIATNGSTNVTLSPQDLLSCGHVRTPPKYMLGCDGGVPEYAWKYLEDTGISTDACIPFVTVFDNETEVCPTNEPCDTKKYKVKMGTTRLLNGASSAAQQYMSDPVNGGPIQAVFYVYGDFFHYKSGIYKHTNMTQKYLGKHSIKIVGYGIDSIHGNYWTVANSWGPNWGMDGFFNIGFGECMIESEMVLGQPEIH